MYIDSPDWAPAPLTIKGGVWWGNAWSASKGSLGDTQVSKILGLFMCPI